MLFIGESKVHAWFLWLYNVMGGEGSVMGCLRLSFGEE